VLEGAGQRSLYLVTKKRASWRSGGGGDHTPLLEEPRASYEMGEGKHRVGLPQTGKTFKADSLEELHARPPGGQAQKGDRATGSLKLFWGSRSRYRIRLPIGTGHRVLKLEDREQPSQSSLSLATRRTARRDDGQRYPTVVYNTQLSEKRCEAEPLTWAGCRRRWPAARTCTP